MLVMLGEKEEKSESSSPSYSVVTDLARFRGKSTSTPFITARSDGLSALEPEKSA